MGPASRWATREAHRRYAQAVRRMWRHIAVMVLVGSCTLVGLLLVLPSPSSTFLAGTGAASMVWIVFVSVRDVAGGGNLAMGAAAESWTSEELRRMKGWRCLDAIDLGGRDVDHVAIGPGGAYAVETKWSATKWSLTGSGRHQLERHAAQARNGSRDIRLRLRSHNVRLDVAPLLVLWGREFDESVPDITRFMGVDVVKGKALDVWCRARIGNQLSVEQVSDAGTALDSFITERRRMVRQAERSVRQVRNPDTNRQRQPAG